MKLWGKKEEAIAAHRGVTRAALDGASRYEIVSEALRELRAEGSADRIGIWLANSATDYGNEDRIPSPAKVIGTSPNRPLRDEGHSLEPAWRGVVWDRESESAPAEWEQLSGEALLPQDLVLGGRAVEQELQDRSGHILIGILIELRKVLWVPIENRGVLRGVILCGTREKHRILPRTLPQRLAAELVLHLAHEDERAVAREREADIALARRVYHDLDAGEQADTRGDHRGDCRADRRAEVRAEVCAEVALARITDSIVDSDADGLGVGAAFASIAALPDAWSPDTPAANIDFRWNSGDADWLRVAESEAFSETWREALRKREPAGSAPQALRMHTPISRIVALPIEAEGELCGLMLVGLFRRGTSLAALQRLEYRAALAAQAVARWKRARDQSRAALRQRAQLAASPKSLLVLDARGRVAELSARADELIREGRTGATAGVDMKGVDVQLHTTHVATKNSAKTFATDANSVSPAASSAAVGEFFPELFGEKDRQRVADWLSRDLSRDVELSSTNGCSNSRDNANETENVLIETAPIDHALIDDALIAELRNGMAVRLRRELPTAQGQLVVALEMVARETVALETGERTAASAESVDSELALEGVIAWLEEGVVLFDAQNKVRARNTRFEQFAGLGPAESAKGATLEQLIARMAAQAAEPAQFAARWRNLARGIEGGVREELRMTQPISRILERAARPVLDASGRNLGRVEVYRDLTAHRVFQSQLLQTEKLAALGQMVTGVAHELSNPLTSILGYAQRLLLREDGAGRLPEVRQIFQEAERASGILRQLLFSARETPPERRRVALNQVVLRSTELQRFSMAAEKILLELDLDPSLPAVIGDAAQLQQVLMNLVGNARQAIEQKGQGGRILVRTRQIAERRVQLEIEDDGPGVPQSILARIFDPFFTTKAEGVGTGLGLSIVLSIVREHGGRVNVLNAPEGGAIFSIELPMAEGLAAAGPAWPAGSFALAPRASVTARDDPRADGADVLSGVQSHGQSSLQGDALVALAENHLLLKARAPVHGRVLVVEDEPTVARLIADVLQDEGLTVEVLLDGRDGLKRAAEQRFDLVICDMRMPGVDGQQFYQSLVRSGNELQHNFLFVTGDVIAPATHAFLERHHLPHLAKPFRVEELTDRVRGVLHQKHAALAASKPAAANHHKRKNAASKACQ